MNQAVKEALEAELEHLQARRSKLDGKIQALRAILDPVDKLELFELPLQGLEAQEGAASAANGALAGMGLRKAMRAVLASYPSGLRPVDLAAKLEEGGYRPGGKTGTKPLVYGEVHRLKKLGKLQKRGKRYQLPPEAQEP